jgi:hypothetical protein
MSVDDLVVIAHTGWVWEVEVTDEFVEWWETLDVDQQAALGVRIDLLESRGPDLGRPSVDRIKGSRHHNMKELRASEGGALRVLFAFDLRRQAILLLGGDKSGEWYEWAIPAADDLYDEYLDELREERLIE